MKTRLNFMQQRWDREKRERERLERQERDGRRQALHDAYDRQRGVVKHDPAQAAADLKRFQQEMKQDKENRAAQLEADKKAAKEFFETVDERMEAAAKKRAKSQKMVSSCTYLGRI